jgi:multisubunit Na+/H+ antiporter MnhF subunit
MSAKMSEPAAAAPAVLVAAAAPAVVVAAAAAPAVWAVVVVATLVLMAAAAAVRGKRVLEKVVIVDAVEIAAAVVMETRALLRSQRPQYWHRWAPGLRCPKHYHHQ